MSHDFDKNWNVSYDRLFVNPCETSRTFVYGFSFLLRADAQISRSSKKERRLNSTYPNLVSAPDGSEYSVPHSKHIDPRQRN